MYFACWTEIKPRRFCTTTLQQSTTHHTHSRLLLVLASFPLGLYVGLDLFTSMLQKIQLKRTVTFEKLINKT